MARYAQAPRLTREESAGRVLEVLERFAGRVMTKEQLVHRTNLTENQFRRGLRHLKAVLDQHPTTAPGYVLHVGLGPEGRYGLITAGAAVMLDARSRSRYSRSRSLSELQYRRQQASRIRTHDPVTANVLDAGVLYLAVAAQAFEDADERIRAAYTE